MSGGILTMSVVERERGCLVRQSVRGELSQCECAERLGIGVRQFKRLVRASRLELDGIKVSVEMVRRIQIDLGLWRPKTRRAWRVFQLRQRRPRFGELIQIDGSPHDWFEGRGPRCTLIVFIDDAPPSIVFVEKLADVNPMSRAVFI